MQTKFKIKEKKVKKSIIFILVILLFSVLLIACDKDNQGASQSQEEDSQMQIYFLDATQTSIVGMDYVPKSDTTDQLIKELIDALSQNPDHSSMKKAKPDSVIVQGYSLTDDGRLTFDFNSEYNNLTGIAEVLCRATIVKTLSQVEEVEYIEFTVNGQPLMDSKGKPIGFMHTNNFIHSTNAEDVYVTVYFSNKQGTALLPSNLRITYDGNIPIVELILNRLILGPVEDNMIQTVPEETKLNSITTKEGICYVDLNEEFLNYNAEIDPEIVIYSIVNSLVELSYVSSVSFTINGTMIEDYNGIKFNEPFDRKLEIIDYSS